MLPAGYQLRSGFRSDRGLLVKFMDSSYRELFPQQKNFVHLTKTVEQYFSSETPLWWVEWNLEAQKDLEPIACLWMGNAIDQVKGDRYSHIFLLYVAPAHRRKGIGRELMQQAENWARNRGDRQISLQVFTSDRAALNLYQNLDYQVHSLLMIKPL